MNHVSHRLYILLSLAMLCILVNGCSEYLSGSGIVWVGYSVITKDDRIPVDIAVREFLLQEGYTSRVIETYYGECGYKVQKMYLGSDVDPSPLINDLRDLPGVLLAELDVDTEDLSERPPVVMCGE